MKKLSSQKPLISMGANERKCRIFLFLITEFFWEPHRLSISKLVGAK
jgi:hypothetical protein